MAGCQKSKTCSSSWPPIMTFTRIVNIQTFVPPDTYMYVSWPRNITAMTWNVVIGYRIICVACSIKNSWSLRLLTCRPTQQISAQFTDQSPPSTCIYHAGTKSDGLPGVRSPPARSWGRAPNRGLGKLSTRKKKHRNGYALIMHLYFVTKTAIQLQNR